MGLRAARVRPQEMWSPVQGSAEPESLSLPDPGRSLEHSGGNCSSYKKMGPFSPMTVNCKGLEYLFLVTDTIDT